METETHQSGSDRLLNDIFMGRAQRIKTSFYDAPRRPFRIRYPTGQRSELDEAPIIRSTGSGDPPKTVNDATETIPIPAQPKVDDFKSLLTEYGRSIIKSAIDHTPNASETLKDNIITAKEKIIVKHKTVENELRISEEEVARLMSEVSNLKSEVSSVRNELIFREKKKDHLIEYLIEQRASALKSLTTETVKRKELEAEVADLKRDRKRKRESIAEIWEKAENVKLN